MVAQAPPPLGGHRGLTSAQADPPRASRPTRGGSRLDSRRAGLTPPGASHPHPGEAHAARVWRYHAVVVASWNWRRWRGRRGPRRRWRPGPRPGRRAVPIRVEEATGWRWQGRLRGWRGSQGGGPAGGGERGEGWRWQCRASGSGPTPGRLTPAAACPTPGLTLPPRAAHGGEVRPQLGLTMRPR